jgi:hypothetical protein
MAPARRPSTAERRQGRPWLQRGGLRRLSGDSAVHCSAWRCSAVRDYGERGGPGRKAAAVSSRAASAEVSTAVLGLERSLPGNVLADLFLAFVPGFFDFDSDSGNVDLSTACSSSASGASRQGRRAPRQASSASVPNSGSQWSARRRQLPVAIYSPGSSVGAADIFRHGRPA